MTITACGWNILAGFVIGWLLGRWILRRELQPLLEKLEDALREEEKP